VDPDAENMCGHRRYIVAVVLVLGYLTSSAQSYILLRKFSFQFQQLPVESALDTISKTIGYSFSYNPVILEGTRPVTSNFIQMPLIQILKEVFNNKELQFKEVCSYIAITKKTAVKDTFDMFITSYTDSSEYYYLKAKVEDLSNKKPVPFANVVLKGHNLGTVSNMDGNFSLKIPSGCSKDSMIISSIGYKTIVRNISEVTTGEIIKIEPVSIELNEVIVEHFEPKTLIRNALFKIDRNYSTTPQMQLGFYRETSQQNNDYIVISEAVLKIFKAAYDHNYQTDKVIVYKSRKSPFVKTMDTVQYKLQGGIYNSLMIDIAKSPASFISEDYFDMYNYKFEGLTKYNDGAVYVVSFDQKPDVHYPLYKGKMYIDAKSLAFVKAEFCISPYGLIYATSMLIRKSSSKIRAKVLDANYLVSYTNQDSIWQLHHVREEIKIRVRKKLSFFNSNYHSVSELVITDADTIKVTRFRNSEIVKPNHVFAEATSYYDEGFWGKFNFIQPEISLEEAYRKIRNALVKKKE
jgi:hypothetical protein